MSLRLRAFLALLLLPLPGALAQADKIKVPRVTIQDRAVPLERAVKAFTEQTGLAVDVAADLKASTPLSLDLNQAPLWKALDAIAEQAGARVYLFRGDGRPGLVKRADGARLFVSHDGIFRVAVRRLTATSDFETGSRSTTATLEVAWDPRFLPVYMETKPRAFVVHDAAGKALPARPAGSLWSSVDGRMAQAVDVSLPALPPADNRLGLLKGEFLVRGAPRMLTFQFGPLDRLDPKKPVEQAQDGVTCTVTGVKLRKTVWTVQVTTKLPAGGPEFESFQSWDVLNEIYLLHKKDGTRLTISSLIRDTAGSEKAVVSYHFELTPQQQRSNPADWVLVYRAPAGIVELAVPFEFKDVPLR